MPSISHAVWIVLAAMGCLIGMACMRAPKWMVILGASLKVFATFEEDNEYTPEEAFEMAHPYRVHWKIVLAGALIVLCSLVWLISLFR